MTDEPRIPTSSRGTPLPPRTQSYGPALPRFPLGQVVATPGALRVLELFSVQPFTLINRHVTGDWGDLSSGDKYENEIALAEEGRILSAYVLSRQDESGAHTAKLYVITEADRSSTCVLRPDEY